MDQVSLVKEIRKDLKEINYAIQDLKDRITHIDSKMVSTEKFQNLELEVNSLQTQFKIVWAAMGVMAITALSSLVISVFKVIGWAG